MLQPDVSVDDINRLAGQIKEQYSYETLQQGWRYYRKQAVSQMREEAGRIRIIRAEVHETKRYQVSFHLKRTDASTCTCRNGGECHHKAAVFFQLCEVAGKKPELYLSDFRQAYIEKERHRTAARKREAHRAERERRMRASQMTLSLNASAEEWHLLFHKKYAKSFTDFQSAVTDITKWVKEQLYRDSEEMPEPVRTLLQMHIQLFILKQISERYAQAASGVHSRDIAANEAMRPCMEELQRLATRFDRSGLARYGEHVRYLGNVVEKLALSKEESPVDRLAAFALIWSEVLNHEVDLQEERMRLKKQLDPLPSLHSRLRDAIRVALIHIESLLGCDEQAIEHMQMLTYYNEPDRYLRYAQERMKTGKYDKFFMWLKALAPMVNRSRHSEQMEQYWRLWKQSYEALPEMHQELDVLLHAMLPGVYSYLSAFLLEQGRYRDWADIQILRRISPEEKAEEWRVVAEAAPEMLLPLYHQAIERHIEERSREQYRLAVTLLQQLRSLYEQSDSLSAWTRYLDGLHKQYSSLRAFQEELRRGALLT